MKGPSLAVTLVKRLTSLGGGGGRTYRPTPAHPPAAPHTAHLNINRITSINKILISFLQPGADLFGDTMFEKNMISVYKK